MRNPGRTNPRDVDIGEGAQEVGRVVEGGSDEPSVSGCASRCPGDCVR